MVKVLALRTAGTNCDYEGIAAFRAAGAEVDHRHVKEIYSSPREIEKYQIIFFPGGFSYGDDVAAGKIQAVETKLFLFDEISKFVDRGGLVLGVCNGFQVLVKTGLLPGFNRGTQEASLIYNDSARFEDRWVRLKTEKCRCEFLPAGLTFDVPTAHGEGKFIPMDEQMLRELEKNQMVAFHYVDAQGKPTMEYPLNPNGSTAAIAGICDRTGRILGLMPHPERNSLPYHHPQWHRQQPSGTGLEIFKSLVKAAR